MRVVDLSWPVETGMIVFPGDFAPRVEVQTTIEEKGWRSSVLHLSSHAGTHMDAPAHMVADGKCMDELPNETFFGFAQVVDVRGCAGGKIEIADIKKQVDKIGIGYVDFLLFQTGWSEKWGKEEEYLRGFPVLSDEAAAWVAAQPLKGIGVDAISIDPVDSTTCAVHKTILGKGLVVIENLRSLDEVGTNPFCLAALPISLKRQDGGTARVMAILD